MYVATFIVESLTPVRTVRMQDLRDLLLHRSMHSASILYASVRIISPVPTRRPTASSMHLSLLCVQSRGFKEALVTRAPATAMHQYCEVGSIVECTMRKR